MSTQYYLQSAQLQSKPLTAGSPEHALVCNFLELPDDATSTLEVIEKAFEEIGWCFQFDGEKITGLEGNDDGEMPDLDDLEPLIPLLNGYVEYECEGDMIRSLFTGGMVVHSEGELIFDASVYAEGKELQAEIEWAEARLSALKAKLDQQAA